MADEALTTEILEIVKNNVPPGTPEITDMDANLYDHGIDSLDFSSILLTLEEKYNFKISDEDMDGLTSVNTIVKYLSARL